MSTPILAPSERAVVDVLFDTAGQARLEHRTPDTTYPLATIAVAPERVEDPAPGLAFDEFRTNPDMAAERERIAPQVNRAPDKTLAFVAEMDFAAPDGADAVYTCPMHPEVVSHEQGRCPKCGMKLMPAALVGESSEHHEHDHGAHETADGIEWEDDMVEVNRMTTPANMRWKLIDGSTGAENDAIDWRFTVGDQVKIRLVNEMDSDHP